MKFENLTAFAIGICLVASITGCGSAGALTGSVNRSCKEVKAIGAIMTSGEERRITGQYRPGLTFATDDSSYTSIQTLRGFDEAVIFKGNTDPVYAGITSAQSEHAKIEKDYVAVLQGLQKCFGVPALTAKGGIKSASFNAKDFFITWQSFQEEGKVGYNVIYISRTPTAGYMPEFR